MATDQSTIPEFYCYVFRNPLKNNAPFYVGKGKGRRGHQSSIETKDYNPHKKRTIKKIRDAGLEPTIWIVWRGSSEETAFQIETRLIEKWGRKCDGGILTNLTVGGDGVAGHKHSAESRLRMSKARIGTKHSESWKRNSGAGLKGHVVSAEARRKISDAISNPSEETRQKMRDAWTRRRCIPVSTETRQKLSDAYRKVHGPVVEPPAKEPVVRKPCSEATRQKMRDTRKNVSAETRKKLSEAGLRCSEETRQKNRDAQTGRKHSEATKQKIRDARVAYWADKQLKSGLATSMAGDFPTFQRLLEKP